MKKILTILALGALTACTKEPKKEFITTPSCLTNPMEGRWYMFKGEIATTFPWNSDMIIDSVSADSFTATFPYYNLRMGDTVMFSSKAGVCNSKTFAYTGSVTYEKMEIRVNYIGSSGDTLVDSVYYDGLFRHAKFYKRIW